MRRRTRDLPRFVPSRRRLDLTPAFSVCVALVFPEDQEDHWRDVLLGFIFQRSLNFCFVYMSSEHFLVVS